MYATLVTMTKEEMLNQVIKACGFEDAFTIEFSHAVERDDLTIEQLAFVAEAFIMYGFAAYEE